MAVVDRDEYVRLLTEVGLEHRVDALVDAMRLSARLEPRPYEAATDLGRSRYSGPPDLAPDIPWPTNPGGVHLAFVAQINLAHMPAEVTAGKLPTDGWLHFFYDTQEWPWGLYPHDRGGWSVAYTPAGTPLAPRPAPDEHTGMYTAEVPMTLDARVEATIVPAFSIDATLVLPDSEMATYLDAYADLEDELNDTDEPIHRLLGHPDPIQGGDMQLGCQLRANDIAYGADESTDPRYEAVAAGAPAWHLLLQLDSDPTTGVRFDDNGRIYYWMTDHDRATSNWDATWLALHCY